MKDVMNFVIPGFAALKHEDCLTITDKTGKKTISKIIGITDCYERLYYDSNNVFVITAYHSAHDLTSIVIKIDSRYYFSNRIKQLIINDSKYALIFRSRKLNKIRTACESLIGSNNHAEVTITFTNSIWYYQVKNLVNSFVNLFRQKKHGKF